MDIEEKLAKIGITGKLFKLYMAAVELGEAPVQEVATRAGLARTTAYDVLARLEQEELIRVEERQGRRFIVAEDPVGMLQRLELRRQVLGDLMPQIRSLYNRAKGKPQIRFYEGEEGVRTVLWETLSCQSKVLRGILSMDELIETPGLEEMDSYIAERLNKGIKLQVLRSRHKDTERIWPSTPQELRELRYAPENITLSVTQYVYDDKVAIISSKRENYGLVIESEDFARLQTALFETLWSLSAPAEEPPPRPAARRRKGT
ncbi:MAG: transcriptional regulator TrmB [Rhizobiales bacterium 24-66-13]|jgi:sugar-specific transcriptional regulator TrmB|nr:MAG: transcriptional regulator TrmB [Rhizobiales bacterium 35-66-30]OYZ69407.1 MAG: transcriptional regulator TrmB [Rhizobiales bacterium 24-66-13]HQS08877.1 helix-turn-helix domain-containing protein [Xanthobacteraceae bacterium]HQS45091.1 helix-turn-helix domain-containing protein [Xanthobacteraceae bacterium]